MRGPRRVASSSSPKKVADLRCRACGTLLAREDGGQIVIRRGDLQATLVASDGHAAVVCYRPTCGELNLFSVTRPPPNGG